MGGSAPHASHQRGRPRPARYRPYVVAPGGDSPRATGRPPGSRSSAPANPAVLIRRPRAGRRRLPITPASTTGTSTLPAVRHRVDVQPQGLRGDTPRGPSGGPGAYGRCPPVRVWRIRRIRLPHPSRARCPAPRRNPVPEQRAPTNTRTTNSRATCRAIRHASPSPIPASYGFQRSPASRGSQVVVCGSQQWGAAPPHDPRAAPAGRPPGPSPERGGWVAAVRVTHPPAEVAYGGRRRPGAGGAAYPCVPSAYPSAYPLFMPSDLVFLF